MRKVLVLLVGAVLVVAFSGSDVLAKRHLKRERPERHGFMGNPEVMKERLGLSDEQIDKISEINLDYKKKYLEYREKIAPKKIKLRQMLLEENVDLQVVRSLLKEISDLRLEVKMLRIKQRLDIEKILTPSQREKLKASKMEMRKRYKRKAK